jgi:hypothetical protein
LEDFKAILGLDDREDALSRYCLVTATFAIEKYCKRRFFMKKYFERIEYHGDLLLPLREYPVREVLAVYALYHTAGPEPVEPEFYGLFPEIKERLDIPYALRLSPALERFPGLTAFKAVYRAGPENFTANGDSSWPHAMPHYSSTRSMFRVYYRAGYRPGKVVCYAGYFRGYDNAHDDHRQTFRQDAGK